MIRVLHVIGAMDRGGAETMIMNLYRAIDRERIQFDFLVHEQRVCDYDEEIQDMGGRIFRGMPRYTLVNHGTYRKQCQEFFGEHDEHPIVHGHIASCAAVYLNEAKKANRIALAHSHSQRFSFSVAEVGFRAVTYPIRFVADEFLACSVEAGEYLFGSKVVQGDHFHVVRNAIDVSSYACDSAGHAQAKSLIDCGDSPLIGHVGRFDPIKNHPFLIDVFQNIKGHIPNAKLILVGRGPEEQRIQTLVREKGLEDDVIFFGVTDKVSDVLKACDAFVFPSFAEGLSMASIEAQTAGVPCVLSTGVPKLAEVAPKYVTFMPLDKGPECWAEKVVNVLASPRERSAAAGEVRERGFDINDVSLWLTEYYETLI